MKRDFPLRGKRLDYQLIESPGGIPVQITKIIPRRIVFIRLEFHTPGLARARNGRLPRTMATGGPDTHPQTVKLLEKGSLKRHKRPQYSYILIPFIP